MGLGRGLVIDGPQADRSSPSDRGGGSVGGESWEHRDVNPWFAPVDVRPPGLGLSDSSLGLSDSSLGLSDLGLALGAGLGLGLGAGLWRLGSVLLRNYWGEVLFATNVDS